MRSKAPERPKLGPLVPVIDAILEADKTAPPKQRHTAKRIFERLRIEHGYAGVVKDYVRIARTQTREVFVPLAHPPGHAQVDFGECIGVIAAAALDAIRLGAISFDAVKQLVIAKVEHRPAKLDLGDYPYLPAAHVRTTSAADYMALVSGSAT